MSYADFCRLTPDEWVAIYETHAKFADAGEKSAWERSRMEAYISLLPHMRKGRHIKPHDVLAFPWDTHNDETPTLSPEEKKKRMKELREQFEKTNNPWQKEQ